METELSILLFTAISVSVLHTVSGPDHYIPFIAIGKSKGWKLPKIVMWTAICGSAHVLASVLLAIGGAAIGFSLGKIDGLNEVRGGLASWAIFIFGILYFLYGLYNIYRDKRHKHFDVYDDGSVYVFEHNHKQMTYPTNRRKVTPWILLLIFLLGPCEVLFPLLTYPAVEQSSFTMFLLIGTFLLTTVSTMMLVVMLLYYGFSFVKTEWLEKNITPISGLSIAICGIGMVFLGW
ncbi:urease accessory protein UreH domain-containing protein [Hwangdonia seohaensis]|uniref:Sulfite exporter TauE/SafE family protein n=1 Tax=Hwangdonia seohaensis TaxID=1240727 RepID=A0ABW3R782_9FLAO|nr:sulfite exporter TauE/SafE family protein [Hwangdonia seohaensis]